MNSVARLAAILVAASLPVVFDYGAVARAAALYPLAASGNPYWVPSHALLLYVWTPAVVLSACVLLLTPGLLLALAAGVGRTVAVWVVAGFMSSIVAVSAIAGVVQAVIGAPLVARGFAATVEACSAASLALLCYRVIHGRRLQAPWSTPNGWPTMIAITGMSLLLLIALAPKFYWESFNADGAHSFESARLLLRQPVPFWGPDAGGISTFPGITTALYAYPESWFIRLFGTVEAAVRVPWVMYLATLFCAIVAVAEEGRAFLGRIAQSLICLGLLVYAVTLAYSATYSPYSADVAMPATQDTLFMVMFLAYVLFFVEERSAWMAPALVLAYLTLPSATLLVELWLIGVSLQRARPWRRVVLSLFVMALCIVASALAPAVFQALNLPPPGKEYAGVPILRYFEFLQFTDWRRIAYAVVPGGIAPAVALFAWRRHDWVGKALVVVTAAYFAFFFIQAHVALHHFVPAMALPLAIFWRSIGNANGRHRTAVLSSVGVAGLVALVLSLPRDARPQLISRQIGVTVEDRTAGYERSDPTSIRRKDLLLKLFPIRWNVPDGTFAVSPVVFFYYAHHAPPGRRSTNYVLQPLADPAPDQSRLVAAEGDAAVYVRDTSVWASQLALRPPMQTGSPIYVMQPETLFRSEVHKPSSHVIDTRRALRSVGIDIGALRRRLANGH